MNYIHVSNAQCVECAFTSLQLYCIMQCDSWMDRRKHVEQYSCALYTIVKWYTSTILSFSCFHKISYDVVKVHKGSQFTQCDNRHGSYPSFSVLSRWLTITLLLQNKQVLLDPKPLSATPISPMASVSPTTSSGGHCTSKGRDCVRSTTPPPRPLSSSHYLPLPPPLPPRKLSHLRPANSFHDFGNIPDDYHYPGHVYEEIKQCLKRTKLLSLSVIALKVFTL